MASTPPTRHGFATASFRACCRSIPPFAVAKLLSSERGLASTSRCSVAPRGAAAALQATVATDFACQAEFAARDTAIHQRDGGCHARGPASHLAHGSFRSPSAAFHLLHPSFHRPHASFHADDRSFPLEHRSFCIVVIEDSLSLIDRCAQEVGASIAATESSVFTTECRPSDIDRLIPRMDRWTPGRCRCMARVHRSFSLTTSAGCRLRRSPEPRSGRPLRGRGRGRGREHPQSSTVSSSAPKNGGAS